LADLEHWGHQVGSGGKNPKTRNSVGVLWRPITRRRLTPTRNESVMEKGHPGGEVSAHEGLKVTTRRNG